MDESEDDRGSIELSDRTRTEIADIVSNLEQIRTFQTDENKKRACTMLIDNLSAMLGHVSSATTLDVYSHITDTMQEKAAVSINRKIGKTDAQYHEESKKTVVDQRGFKAVEGNRRRPGTGCLHQISKHLWEGRYSRKNGEGKRVARTVYGKTKEECEEKLAALVESMKAEKLAQNSPEKTQDMDVPLLTM